MRTQTAVLALLLLLITGTVVARNSQAENRQSSIADKWIAAWNSHDPDKLVSLFSTDVMYEDVAFGQVSHGAAELRKFAADEFAAVPDLHVELEDSFIQGGHGSIQWKFSGTDTGMFKTGKKFNVRGVSIITVSNGKISRNFDYYDVATMMRQVGTLPQLAQ